MNEHFEKLKDLIGEKSFQALRDKKAVLKIWRRTTPANIYVSYEGNYVWHSSSERPFVILDFLHTCFKKIADSTYKPKEF